MDCLGRRRLLLLPLGSQHQRYTTHTHVCTHARKHKDNNQVTGDAGTVFASTTFVCVCVCLCVCVCVCVCVHTCKRIEELGIDGERLMAPVQARREGYLKGLSWTISGSDKQRRIRRPHHALPARVSIPIHAPRHPPRVEGCGYAQAAG